MKTQSNIPIPDVQFWKAGQWAIAINKIDHGYLPTGDPFTDKSGQRYEADFTIIDALTAEAALYAFTRQQNDIVHDNKVIHNIEVNGQPAILTKPVYQTPAQHTIFPALPAVGTALETGQIFSYNNGSVMVRQPHNRTIYAPELTPALFSFYRTVTEGQEWIAGEQISVNSTRTYNSKLYKCLQPHQSQESWNPVLTLNVLWSEVVAPPATPTQWVSANWAQYVLNYEVLANGKIWKVKGVTHTWIQPAMTGNGAISWAFVRNA